MTLQVTESIVIVGGGPVGSTLALLLAQQGISSHVFESRTFGASHKDKRALALAYGSRLIFEKLGVWDAIATQATAIKTIHVSEKGSFGRSKLQAGEYGLEALGYVVSYGALSQVLDDAIGNNRWISFANDAVAQSTKTGKTTAQVDIMQHNQLLQLSTPLAVIADGGRNLADLTHLTKQTKPYGHDALVTKISAELPHNNTAYERFTSSGPVALLPNGARDFSLVWTAEHAQIQHLLTLSDDDFMAAFHDHFGDRLGKFLSVEKRLSFPLIKSQLVSDIQPHLIVIGNAAQTMHPVAGQGFNVGLRDANALTAQIAKTSPVAWGGQTMLEMYTKDRLRDTQGGLIFTDFLVTLFSNDFYGLSPLRGASLALLDMVKPAKRLLVHKMSYGK